MASDMGCQVWDVAAVKLLRKIFKNRKKKKGGGEVTLIGLEL